MSAYALFDVRAVHDQSAMDVYRSRVVATVERYGGRYRVIGGPARVLEGEWRPTFPVLIEFPDLGAARAWYESPEYRDLLALRLGAVTSDAVLVDGLPGP